MSGARTKIFGRGGRSANRPARGGEAVQGGLNTFRISPTLPHADTTPLSSLSLLLFLFILYPPHSPLIFLLVLATRHHATLKSNGNIKEKQHVFSFINLAPLFLPASSSSSWSSILSTLLLPSSWPLQYAITQHLIATEILAKNTRHFRRHSSTQPFNRDRGEFNNLPFSYILFSFQLNLI